MITAALLRELLHYCPATGKFTWRVQLSRKMPVGKVAGSLRPDGRRYVCIFGKHYFTSRLAWMYVTGEWPEHEIDHRDRNRTNDAFFNLRPSTRQQNCFNTGVRKDSSTRRKGVSYEKRTGKWFARISVSGKSKVIGTYATADQAEAAYVDAARMIQGVFAPLETMQ